MSDFKPGLEGVVAFETEIAEPDREGGALRYRGVDIEELVGNYRSSRSGACSSTRASTPGLPAAEPYEGGGLTGQRARRPAGRDRAARWRVGRSRS